MALSREEKNALAHLVIQAERRRDWILDCGAEAVAALFQTYIERLQSLQSKDNTYLERGIREARTLLAEGLDVLYHRPESEETELFEVLFSDLRGA